MLLHKIVCGYIDLDFDGIQEKCEVVIQIENELENCPHFHILCENKQYDCPIMLYDDRYYHHMSLGVENIIDDTDISVLDEWMDQISFNNITTNWELLCIVWTLINENDNLEEFEDYPQNQPKYTNINKHQERDKEE